MHFHLTLYKHTFKKRHLLNIMSHLKCTYADAKLSPGRIFLLAVLLCISFNAFILKLQETIFPKIVNFLHQYH